MESNQARYERELKLASLFATISLLIGISALLVSVWDSEFFWYFGLASVLVGFAGVILVILTVLLG